MAHQVKKIGSKIWNVVKFQRCKSSIAHRYGIQAYFNTHYIDFLSFEFFEKEIEKSNVFPNSSIELKIRLYYDTMACEASFEPKK